MQRIKNKRLITKFVVVGVIGFITNYAILEFSLVGLTDNKLIAAIMAMAVTINITFILHDKWTYNRDSKDYYLSISKRYLSYLSTNSSGSIITITLFGVLSNSLQNIVALGIAALCAMVWNFTLNLVVWRHKKPISKSSDILSLD